MPSDDYAAIGGGLKLKGSKPAGITKKKKKPKTHIDGTSSTSKDAASDGAKGGKSALQRALEDEDIDMSQAGRGQKLDEARLKELDPRGNDGKTASERQYEETRRKRVCYSTRFLSLAIASYHVIYSILQHVYNFKFPLRTTTARGRFG